MTFDERLRKITHELAQRGTMMYPLDKVDADIKKLIRETLRNEGFEAFDEKENVG